MWPVCLRYSIRSHDRNYSELYQQLKEVKPEVKVEYEMTNKTVFDRFWKFWSIEITAVI